MTDQDSSSGFTSDTSVLSAKDVVEMSTCDIPIKADSSNEDIKVEEIEHDQTESCEASDEENEISNTQYEWEDVLGSGSLMKLIIKEGVPDSRPQRLQNCIIKYECALADGTVVEKSDHFEVHLGDCEVIQGLDLALGLMNTGEQAKLKLESRLAYGSKGLPPTVPPDETVYIKVELLSVEHENDLEMLSISERRLIGNKKRERGNWWYSRGENQIAIQCYRRALDYLDEVEGGITSPLPDGETEISDADLQQLLEDRINVSNNMAAAQLKLELYDAALQSLQTVLRCQPENVKALFRKAKVHRAKNDIQSALSCLKKAQKASPSNTDISKEIVTLEKLKEKQKKSEKELARRMFNGLQASVQNEKNKPKSKMFMWCTVGASVIVGLAGFAAYRLKIV